jgi:hypothetical protein
LNEVVRREVVSKRIYQLEVLVVMYWKRGEWLQVVVVGLKSRHQDA